MNDTSRVVLLKFARETMAAHLADRPLPALPRLEPDTHEHGGVFVTLRHHGRLRGCIGEFRPGHDLVEAVRTTAIAVLADPRFTAMPVGLEELPRLSIEISVLSPMRRTDQPELLEPGVHGVYVRRGSRVGCFLPQVATEQGWDAHRLLEYCCAHKAGLPQDAWKDPDTEVYLFTAEILDEHPTGL